jgi:hypothetical protein
MKSKIEHKFTLSTDDIKIAVARYLSDLHKMPIAPQHVEVAVNPGLAYYDPSDPGTPARVVISATIVDDSD